MNSIKEISQWPDDTTIEAVQGVIVEAYERREVNTTRGKMTVQSAEFKDAAGDTIRVSAWEHPDLSTLVGKEVIIHSVKAGNGKLSGVKTRHNSYKNRKGDVVNAIEISMSKAGQFQLVEVYKQHNPDAAVAPPSESRASSDNHKQPLSKEEGQRLGMCIKLAGDFIMSSKFPEDSMTPETFVAHVKNIARMLNETAQELEKK